MSHRTVIVKLVLSVDERTWEKERGAVPTERGLQVWARDVIRERLAHDRVWGDVQ